MASFQSSKSDVLNERHVEHQGIVVPIFGNEGYIVRPIDGAARDIESAGQQSQQLALTRSFYRCNSDDLTSTNFEPARTVAE